MLNLEMRCADTLGADRIAAELEELAREDAKVWAPSVLIRECAEKNIAFADWKP